MLMQKARDMGVAVMFDVVLNNFGPNEARDFRVFKPLSKEEYFHGGYGNHCMVNKSGRSWSYGDKYMASAQQQLDEESCWLDSEGGALADLNQENPIVNEKLLTWISSLVTKFNPDGIHVQDANHMSKVFLQQLKAVLPMTWIVADVTGPDQSIEYLASYQLTDKPPHPSAGGPSPPPMPRIYGEKWVTSTLPPVIPKHDPAALADRAYGPVLDGVMNYPLFYKLRSMFHNTTTRNLDNFKNFWDTYKRMSSAFHEVGANMNFVDMHTMIRWFYYSPEWSTYKAALVMAFFLPGVPMSIYGAEQNVKGGTHPWHIRQPMWSDTLGYDETAPLYQWMRHLNLARQRTLEILDDEHIDEITHWRF
jgi:glycosidase